MLHSPCDITAAIAEEISALGPVAHIVVPGNFHHLHATSAQSAFPDAKTWICPGIERKRPDLKYDGILGDLAPAEWTGEIDQVLVQGTRIMREVAMYHRASRTLILVDLIENFTDATPHTGGGIEVLVQVCVTHVGQSPSRAGIPDGLERPSGSGEVASSHSGVGISADRVVARRSNRSQRSRGCGCGLVRNTRTVMACRHGKSAIS
jgi:hypothetical protein